MLGIGDERDKRAKDKCQISCITNWKTKGAIHQDMQKKEYSSSF